MTRVNRWAVTALVAAVPLVILLPALAQRASEQQPADVNNAKEIVALIEQGQLSLFPLLGPFGLAWRAAKV